MILSDYKFIYNYGNQDEPHSESASCYGHERNVFVHPNTLCSYLSCDVFSVQSQLGARRLNDRIMI